MRRSLCAIACVLAVAGAACVDGANPRDDNGQSPASQSAADVSPASTRAASADGQEFMGRTADHWIQQLSETAEPAAKTQAVSALASIGPSVAGVTRALIDALADETDLVRTGAVRTLGKFSAEIIPDLVEALNNHPEAPVRAGVAPVLGNQAADPDANEALQKALREDFDPTVRTAAARGLSVGGEASLAAVPALMLALDQDESADVRQWSAIALGRIGPNARDAIPALQEAQDDRDRNVSNAAGMALRQIRQ